MVLYIGIREAARRLNKSGETIRKWASRGLIPHYRVNRIVFFDPSELEEWARSHAKP